MERILIIDPEMTEEVIEIDPRVEGKVTIRIPMLPNFIILFDDLGHGLKIPEEILIAAKMAKKISGN